MCDVGCVGSTIIQTENGEHVTVLNVTNNISLSG